MIVLSFEFEMIVKKKKEREREKRKKEKEKKKNEFVNLLINLHLLFVFFLITEKVVDVRSLILPLKLYLYMN